MREYNYEPDYKNSCVSESLISIKKKILMGKFLAEVPGNTR